MELKGLIYDEVRLHAPHSEQLAGFVLRQEETVAYEMDLTLLGKRAEILGGIVLIGIGAQILWAHFAG